MTTENADTLTPPTAAKALKEKKAVKPKVPKEKKERSGRFNALYPESARLVLLAEGNPKKEGSAARARFEAYFGSATVGEAIAKGATYADIAWDVGHGHLRVEK